MNTISFSLFTAVFYAISNSSAFTPVFDYQSSSLSRGRRTRGAKIEHGYKIRQFESRVLVDRYEQNLSRDVTLLMSTKLKFSDDENGMTNSTVESSSRVGTIFPMASIITIAMDDHVPLGCTVEESLHEDDDHIFISKLTKNGNAEKAGLEVGDVIVGVTGLTGDIYCTIDEDIERIRLLVSSVQPEDPLTIQVARGTDVYERHESTIVDLCSTAGATEKEVEECVVDLWASSYYDYDYDDDSEVDNFEDADNTEFKNDEDTEALVDGMMNLWASELPSSAPPTSEIADQTITTSAAAVQPSENRPKAPKPWSSRSSPSGTWVRDPSTGKMRNIDA